MLAELPTVFELRMAAFLRYCDKGGEDLLRRLRLSNKSATRIRVLLLLCDEPWDRVDESRVRRLMAKAAPYGEDLAPLVKVGFFEIEKSDRARVLDMMTAIQERGDCLSPRDLAIGGRELVQAGFSGSDVGRVLANLYEAVLDDPEKNQKEILTKMAENMRQRP